jgi:GntR family transcriptional regulator
MSVQAAQNLSHLPLYLQIKEALKMDILAGKYAPNERMPSESSLMSTFEVSRITVRQALRDLHAEGLIFTAQGKGTFASKPKASQNVQHLQGFSEAMSQKGYEVSARLLSIRETSPDKIVREKLELDGKEPVVEVVRVRYLNRSPVSVDTSFFPESIGRHLFSKDLGDDIFPILENQLGIQLGRADICLEARAADHSNARHLKTEIGTPIMWVERLTHDVNDKPIDYEYLAFLGDAYKYNFKIFRN